MAVYGYKLYCCVYIFGLNIIILIHYGSRTVVGCVFRLVG